MIRPVTIINRSIEFEGASSGGLCSLNDSIGPDWTRTPGRGTSLLVGAGRDHSRTIKKTLQKHKNP